MQIKTAPSRQNSLAHFPHIVCNFLTDLEDHNDSTWFAQNKARYQREVVEPVKAFFGCLAPVLAALDDRLDANYRVNTTVMRINRDRRFQPDAPPYRTFVKMAWPHLGYKWSNFPVLGLAIFPRSFHVTFRNADAQKRGPYIERYSANVHEHPHLVQEWLDRYRIPHELQRLGGTHDAVLVESYCFERAEQWQEDAQPTIGYLWARDAAARGAPLLNDIVRRLVLLYFLDILAIEDRPVEAAEAYFQRADELLAT